MIPLVGAVGAYFNRLGKLGAIIANADALQTTQLTAFTNTTTGAVAQYNAESDLQAVLGSAYIGQLNAISATPGSLMQQMAAQTANRMVFRDAPRLNQTLTQQNTLSSLEEIIFQMGQQGVTVLEATVAATPTPVSGQPGPYFTGIGNGFVVASVLRPQDGLIQQNAFAEDVQITCSSDSYTGGATAGNEPFAITGTGSTGVFNFDWPLGSNCNVQTNAIDANTDDGNGNLLTNSAFTDWTDDVPDNWSLDVGTAGTNISEETVLVYGDGSSIKLTGDAGGTLTEWTQQFDDTDGTTGTLEPLTQYAFNIMARRDGVVAGAGVLTIDLIDGENPPNVIRDEAETANSFTIDLTSLSTGWGTYTAAFRTPEIMPDAVKIRMRLTTALTNGRSVYLGLSALGEMTQCYLSGPYVAVFSGSEPFSEGDFAFVNVTNSRGAAGTLNTFQTLHQRLFFTLTMQNELMLPYSAVPNVSDALIS